jgi:hypothetical protein
LNLWHLPNSGSVDGHGRVGILRQLAGKTAAEPWQLAACAPQGWIDGSTLLCMAEGSGRDLGAPMSALYTVRLDASAASADAGKGPEQALAASGPLLPVADGRYYGEPLIVGNDLWCVVFENGANHAETISLSGGTGRLVPAADSTFAAPGFFLHRGAVRG